MSKKTVAVDLDGCLNTYSGWRGELLLDPPREGARGFMIALSAKYRVVVHTTRRADLVLDWLREHDIPADDVTSTKPPAVVYLDDRAMLFQGSYDGLLERIDTFRAWWEKT